MVNLFQQVFIARHHKVVVFLKEMFVGPYRQHYILGHFVDAVEVVGLEDSFDL